MLKEIKKIIADAAGETENDIKDNVALKLQLTIGHLDYVDIEMDIEDKYNIDLSSISKDISKLSPKEISEKVEKFVKEKTLRPGRGL